MAVVVTSMAVILLTAASVLGVAYVTHYLARDRRMRARVRRRAVTAAAAFYGARRAAGRHVDRALENRRRRRQQGDTGLRAGTQPQTETQPVAEQGRSSPRP